MTVARVKRSSNGSVTFARTVKSRCPPSDLRSSGTRASPAATATPGCRNGPRCRPTSRRPVSATQAEQTFEEGRLALTLQAGQPADLAGVERQVNTGHIGADDAETDRTQRWHTLVAQRIVDDWSRRKLTFHLPADHHPHDVVAHSVGAFDLARVTSVFEYRDAIGDGEHLFEAVADEHDGAAALAQPTDDLEEAFHLVFAEARRRFVEHEDAWHPSHRLGDLDELTLGEREPANC